MIKFFILVGVIGGLAIAYLSVFALGPVSQLAPPESLLTGYRADGAVPQSVDLAENEDVEHDIFEVPPQDAVELEKAMAALDDMVGMDMGGTDADMDMSGTDADMNMGEGDTPTMDMAEGDTAAMDMQEEDTPHTEDETMGMGEEDAPHAEGEAAGGLLIANEESFDREINLKMTEWGYSNMDIAVAKGETIRFNVVNDGEILHEFMIMEMAAMQAVAYRVNRADWSLLEHEALYEKSLVLPKGSFSFTVEIQETGAWMFMCMLPYHMEMGMMGQMATPGMAMDMQM